MGRSLVACFLLIAVVVAVYHPVLKNDFVNWDDPAEIVENASYNPVTIGGLLWNFSHTRLTLYMPVTYLAWGVVATVGPRSAEGVLKPAAFHGLSLALHAIATVLVFVLVRRCLLIAPMNAGLEVIPRPGVDAEEHGSPGVPSAPGVLEYSRRLGVSKTGFGPTLAAFCGAVIFAVHPIQTEAVAWASGMYTILSTVWSLAAVLCYLNHVVHLRDNPKSYARKWYFLATILFASAVLTKAAAVVVPGIAGVIDLLIVGRPIKRVVASLAPWAVAGIPVVYAAKAFQDLSMVPAPPVWGRPLVASDAIGFYLGKIAWPVNFIPDYGRNPHWLMKQLAGIGPLNPGVDPAWITRHRMAVIPSMFVGTLAVLLLAVTVTARRAPRATAGGLIFMAGIFPYLGLTTFDFQYVSTTADRYAYAGMIGVALIVAAAVSHRRVWIAFAGLWIPLAVFTHRQVMVWQDTKTLFDQTLKVNSVSLVARNVFGFMAARQGRYTEAEWFYQKALMVWPEDAVIHFNLGNLYAGGLRSRPEARQMALAEYRLAVRYQPHFATYRNSLAADLATEGNFPEAIANWRQAVDDDPRYIDAHMNLASAYLTVGQLNEAKSEYETVLEIQPDYQPAKDGLAKTQRRSFGGQNP